MNKLIILFILFSFIGCTTKKEIYFIKEKIVYKTNYIILNKLNWNIISDNNYNIYFYVLNNKILTKVSLDDEIIFASTNESVLYSYHIGLYLRDGYNGIWSNFGKVECVPEIGELTYRFKLPD